MRYNILAVTSGANYISGQFDAEPGEDFRAVMEDLVQRWRAELKQRGQFVERIFVTEAPNGVVFEEFGFRGIAQKMERVRSVRVE